MRQVILGWDSGSGKGNLLDGLLGIAAHGGNRAVIERRQRQHLFDFGCRGQRFQGLLGLRNTLFRQVKRPPR